MYVHHVEEEVIVGKECLVDTGVGEEGQGIGGAHEEDCTGEGWMRGRGGGGGGGGGFRVVIGAVPVAFQVL